MLDPKLLDQLIVPQPPYRMARPRAVLAMAEEEDAKLPPAQEPESEVPEVSLEELEAQEIVAEEVKALESAAAEERTKLENAVLSAEATPEQVAADTGNKEEALQQVEQTKNEETEKLRAIVQGADEKPVEELTSEQRQANQALAARLRAERDRRSQQPSVVEEATQLSNEALAQLEEFKRSAPEPQPAPANPDATVWTGQQQEAVAESFRKAREAAAAVAADAAAEQQAQQQASTEGMPEPKEAQQPEVPAVTPEPVPAQTPEPPKVAEKEEELPLVEAEPIVGEIVPDKGRVIGYDKNDRAIYEPVPGVAYDEAGNAIAVETTEAAKETLERIQPLEEQKEGQRQEIDAAQKELIQKLKEENAALEEQLRKQAEVGGEKKEGKAQEPGEASKAVRDAIDRITARKVEGTFGERFQNILLNKTRSLNRWFWNTRAVYAKARLEAADAELKQLDDEERAFLEKSNYAPSVRALRAAVAPLLFGLWKGRWYTEKAREDYASAAQRFDRYKQQHEAELFRMRDLEAAHVEVAIRQLVAREASLKKAAGELEKEIKGHYELQEKELQELGNAKDSEEYLKGSNSVSQRLELIAELEKEKVRRDQEHSKAVKDLAERRAARNALIVPRDHPLPNTRLELSEEEVGKKPGQRRDRLKKTA